MSLQTGYLLAGSFTNMGNYDLPNSLQDALKSQNRIIQHCAIQHCIAFISQNTNKYFPVVNLLRANGITSIPRTEYMEISKITELLIPWLIEKLNKKRPNEDREDELLCLGRIGVDAKAAIPHLINSLNSSDIDEKNRIITRIVLANIGFHPPQILNQISADLGSSQIIKSAQKYPANITYSVALDAIAYTHVKDWLTDKMIQQIMQLISKDGDIPIKVILILGAITKGNNHVIQTLEKWDSMAKTEDRWVELRRVTGFARYKLELNNRHKYLSDGLKMLGQDTLTHENYGLIEMINSTVMDHELVQHLFERLEDNDPEVRLGALRFLACIGLPAKKAVPRLFELSKNDPNSEIRGTAFMAIGIIADIEMIAEMEKCIQTEIEEDIRECIKTNTDLLKLRHREWNFVLKSL